MRTPARSERRSSASSLPSGSGASCRVMLDETEFLSPYGIRAALARHRDRPVRAVGGRDGAPRRLRAGRVVDRALRRQLELARADLVPGELPAHRVAPEVPPLPRATTSGGVPDRAPGRWLTLEEVAAELSRRLSRIFLRDASGRRPVLRRRPAAPGRSALPGSRPVPRVLPRRRRRRRRREPPDRLDRARGGAHRRRAVTKLREQRTGPQASGVRLQAATREARCLS